MVPSPSSLHTKALKGFFFGCPRSVEGNNQVEQTQRSKVRVPGKYFSSFQFQVSGLNLVFVVPVLMRQRFSPASRHKFVPALNFRWRAELCCHTEHDFHLLPVVVSGPDQRLNRESESVVCKRPGRGSSNQMAGGNQWLVSGNFSPVSWFLGPGLRGGAHTDPDHTE